jgi:8-oxo-dGTP diphosphatase
MIVATTIYKKEDKILLIKKREYQRYTMPGGKAEAGEIPIKAAAREFFEETGLQVNNLALRVVSKVKMGSKEFDMHTYITEDCSGEIEYDNREGDLEWVDIKEIHNIKMYEGDRYIIEHLLSSDSLQKMHFIYDKVRNFVSYSEDSE